MKPDSEIELKLLKKYIEVALDTSSVDDEATIYSIFIGNLNARVRLEFIYAGDKLLGLHLKVMRRFVCMLSHTFSLSNFKKDSIATCINETLNHYCGIENNPLVDFKPDLYRMGSEDITSKFIPVPEYIRNSKEFLIWTLIEGMV